MMPTAGPGSTPYQRVIAELSASPRTNNRPNIADPPAATPTASTTETGVAERGYIFGGKSWSSFNN